MGKKRKSKPMRPWCWYCEKDFEDDKVLVTHQRAKHFKCEECNKKLTTAGGMVVHAQQVHKIAIYKVPNALPGRDKLDVEIFGMEGIPEEDMIAHEMKVMGANNANKKAKSSGSGQYGELTLEQIQQQLAARKAGPTADPTAAAAAPTATATTTAAAQTPVASTGVIAAPPTGPTVPPPSVDPQSQQYYGNTGYNPYYQQPYGQYYPPVPQGRYGMPQPYGYPPPGMPYGAPGQWGYYPPPGMPPQPPMPNTTQQPPMPDASQSQQQPAGSDIPVVTAPTSNDTNVIAPPTPLATNEPQVTDEHITAQPELLPDQLGSNHKISNTTNTGTATANVGGKKKATKIVLIYNNNDISPEEQRAQLERHKVY
ncbi:hypothetical protein A0J61_03368 [Choanephora cucurbitarum]|uniref:C2H2-type domain-containing protein n=1 Tax=Choanephora cucurbitarum TaxID=101091 RepID=A0A1C7NHJ7_9FUNG|nr:hypothetical protein A0J61_03368 [Choanephora cucurbitarum]